MTSHLEMQDLSFSSLPAAMYLDDGEMLYLDWCAELVVGIFHFLIVIEIVSEIEIVSSGLEGAFQFEVTWYDVNVFDDYGDDVGVDGCPNVLRLCFLALYDDQCNW